MTAIATSSTDLVSLVNAAQAGLAPLWPLKDFVAVNPLLGWTDRPFLKAHAELGKVRDAEFLMPLSYFQDQWRAGAFCRQNLEQAVEESERFSAQPESSEWLDRLIAVLEGQSDQIQNEQDSRRQYWTVSEIYDQVMHTSWSKTIVNEISKVCAAHYDQGQAIWPSPWKNEPLFVAWQQIAQRDRRAEKLGLPGFRQFVSELPATAEATIEFCLGLLEIPSEHQANFLLCEYHSIAGWSSFVKCRAREAQMRDGDDADLTGLLAIRLAYDTALRTNRRCAEFDDEFQLYLSHLLAASAAPATSGADSEPAAQADWQRYVCQLACEIAYRQQLAGKLQSVADQTDAGKTQSQRLLAQMVFCIDVRSEVYRRQLEATDARVETCGFAGFFGMPIAFRPWGEAEATPQCPALLVPPFTIEEQLLETDTDRARSARQSRFSVRVFRNVWKKFQSATPSSFSFVESLGFWYAVGLVKSTFGRWGSTQKSREDGVAGTELAEDLRPQLDVSDDGGLTFNEQVALATGMLKNLGLVDNFASLVVLCGHESATANNPFQSSLDCGACGGHSGEINARVAADLLNRPAIREVVAEQGIVIPADVWFVAGVHNTTTDEIRFCDLHLLPAASRTLLDESLTPIVQQASARTRAERAKQLHADDDDAVLYRSRDWSEVRPEWGLAGNAAFVVANRSRTAGRDLGGRVFLHNYDYTLDDDSSVLELIMTAPMVVTNLINMQYYASTVDHAAFGSGNKTLHNVAGKVGVLQGNAGDIMTGLPWQSVHNGATFQHEPLRLTAYIEAPRGKIEAILEKHENVRELVVNRWIHLVAIDDGQFYRCVEPGQWQTIV